MINSIRKALGVDEVDDKIRAIANALVINEVDVCGFAMLSALGVAERFLKTLKSEGYDIIQIPKDKKEK